MSKSKSASGARRTATEGKQGKGKSITLLSIVCVILVALLVITFVRFPIGIRNFKSVLGAIDLDYDVAGGTAYTLTLNKDSKDVEDIDEVIDTLSYRMSELGYQTYSITATKDYGADVKDYDIRIEAKTTDSLASDIAAVVAYGEVEIFGGNSANPSEQILTDIDAISNAEYAGSYNDGETTYYQVAINFTDEAMEIIKTSITSETSYYLEIKMDDAVLLSGSSPITMAAFTGNSLGIISTNEAAARQMALQISSGGLAYEYEISDPVTVTSPYGDNIGMMSAIVVFALIALIMVAFVVLYKGFGIIVSLSLLAFILLEGLLLIAIPGLTISLGGVVGIIVATIITADGMVIIAKRIKEEYAKREKTAKAAVKKGFKQSVLPIVNISIVSAVICGLMLLFVKGTLFSFACTLGIGTLVGLLTNLVFTRMFTSLILPLASDSEKFLNFRKEVA